MWGFYSRRSSAIHYTLLTISSLTFVLRLLLNGVTVSGGSSEPEGLVIVTVFQNSEAVSVFVSVLQLSSLG